MRSNSWEPHDLSFHVLSRQRRKTEVRLLGKRAPEPLFTPRTKGRLISSLLDLEGRQSVLPARSGRFSRRGRRRASSCPPACRCPFSVALLFLAARSKGVSRDETLGDVDHRSYPSGGGRYPLEIHLVVPPKACTGLPAGIYHYRPKEHALEGTARFGAAAKEFVARAIVSSPPLEAERGWLLLAISARIGRTTWKYDSIAYSVYSQGGRRSPADAASLRRARSGSALALLGAGPLDLLARVTGVDTLRGAPGWRDRDRCPSRGRQSSRERMGDPAKRRGGVR